MCIFRLKTLFWDTKNQLLVYSYNVSDELQSDCASETASFLGMFCDPIFTGVVEPIRRVAQSKKLTLCRYRFPTYVPVYVSPHYNTTVGFLSSHGFL